MIEVRPPIVLLPHFTLRSGSYDRYVVCRAAARTGRVAPKPAERPPVCRGVSHRLFCRKRGTRRKRLGIPARMNVSGQRFTSVWWNDWLSSNCPILLIHRRKSLVLDLNQPARMDARRPHTQLVVFNDCSHSIHTETLRALSRWSKFFSTSNIPGRLVPRESFRLGIRLSHRQAISLLDGAFHKHSHQNYAGRRRCLRHGADHQSIRPKECVNDFIGSRKFEAMFRLFVDPRQAWRRGAL